MPQELLHLFAAKVNMAILGILPRDPAILDAEEQGETVITHAPESDTTRRFLGVAAAILERCASTSMQAVHPMEPSDFWTFVREHRFRG